ncbi:unnamed protein product [Moneuplotes crassus]|uniref:PX domain-containing protein n=2 Tax=Euplotes crassus TaxID=5936 RepID=A0AAD1UDI6_EUPCR|nr:unnamed protein product [Moneuplotes crassus]
MEDMKLSEEEQDFYQKVFDYSAKQKKRYKGKNILVASAEDVKRVFSTSNTSNDYLAQIWKFCSNKNRFLIKQDFFKALKCIAVIQKNDSFDDIKTHLKEDFPLPVFDDENIKEFIPKAKEDKEEEKEIQIDNDSDNSDLDADFDDLKMKIEEEKTTFPPKSKASSFSQNKNRNDVEESKVPSGLHISIPKFETITQGWLGMNSYTQYKVVTIANNISPLKNDEYIVWRRFSDFDWLHNVITQTNSLEGVVLPKLPEKSYLQKQDEAFLETRRTRLEGFLKTIVEHSSLKCSEPVHQFLTERNEERFTGIKQKDTSSWKDSIYDYALTVKNFDIDRFVSNISQYFDSEEPEQFHLKKEHQTHIEHLLDYEVHLEKLVDAIEQKYRTTNEISERMTKIALKIEKYRLSSDQMQLRKIFDKNTTVDDDLIEDLDEVSLNKMESKETQDVGKDYVKVERVPFQNNVFPALKAGATANKPLTENWKILYIELKSQLSKVQGLRETLQRRSSAISSYKTNIEVLRKKRSKASASYNLENLQPEIYALEKSNIELDKKIQTMNKVLGQDLACFTLGATIKKVLETFTEDNRKDVSQGVKIVAAQDSKISDK